MKPINLGPKWLPEITSGGEGGHQALAVGGHPALAAIEDDTGLDGQVLDDEVLVALEDGALRAVGQGDDGLFGDGQFDSLGALGGAGPLGIGVARWPGRHLQGAGGDPGPSLQTLEAGDLVFELVDPFLELGDPLLLEANLVFEVVDALLLEVKDLKQPLDERRAFGLRDCGQ